MRIECCYNCGERNRSYYAEENGYTLVKCDGCGLLYLENRPLNEEITQAHKQGKHHGIKELNATGVFLDHKITRYLEILDDIYRGKVSHIHSWLDVGCGHGEFIAALQQYHPEIERVCGTEPNIYKQASARERGLDVGYFDIEKHEKTYDVISLLNVYSHLPDPPEFLKILKGKLNPGGELILETGDTAELNAKDHYRPFLLPDHLSFASEKIVVDILERTGFEIISIHRYPYWLFNIKNLVWECMMALHPRHQSKLKYLLNRKLYSESDLYIRARVVSMEPDS
ncbi:MAG: class I SAM-dependent methyltransferase [Kiritimatiellia bacterium]